VWGVGEGEDGDFHPNLPKDSTTTDSLAKNLCTTPYTPHPTPGAPIPPHPSSEDGVSWARLQGATSALEGFLYKCYRPQSPLIKCPLIANRSD
jgi:hypothetical protein